MKQIFFAFTFSLLISASGKSQSCKRLPDKFNTYSQAISWIENSTFKLIDKLPYGKSSWIVSAKYYSCDGYYGYLVYMTDKGIEYVHEKIPTRVWTEFKKASSSGSFYVSHIKGKYRLVP